MAPRERLATKLHLASPLTKQPNPEALPRALYVINPCSPTQSLVSQGSVAAEAVIDDVLDAFGVHVEGWNGEMDNVPNSVIARRLRMWPAWSDASRNIIFAQRT
jgi:hypothetical protein